MVRTKPRLQPVKLEHILPSSSSNTCSITAWRGRGGSWAIGAQTKPEQLWWLKDPEHYSGAVWNGFRLQTVSEEVGSRSLEQSDCRGDLTPQKTTDDGPGSHFKVLLLTCEALGGLAPAQVSDPFIPYEAPRDLSSSGGRLLLLEFVARRMWVWCLFLKV